MATQLFSTPGNIYLKDGKLVFRNATDENGLELRHDGVFLSGQSDTFFVDADNGSDSNAGDSQSEAKATIGAAITAAASGDVIYVLPGTYDENVDLNKDYLSLVGLYEGGYARPDITPAAGVGLTISAQGVTVRRVRAVSTDSDAAQITGNGFKIDDCVFDGDGNAATDAGIRLWCDAADDSFTASEGKIANTLVRNSGGYGVAFDVQDATVGVGPTHNVLENVRFLANTAEDVIALETDAGTYSMQDNQFRSCSFMSKNKATHVDISTNNGASNTGNVFEDCFFFDDTIDTTAIKAAGTGSGFIGCYSLDGLIDGDALD